MADFWIRVHANLAHKPVAFRAADALGVKHAAAIGHLVMFWGAASQHAKNGHVADYPDAQLESWACWEGRRGVFAKFLREHHLDEDGRVREWDEYGGSLERSRERNRARVARFREQKRESNGDVTITETVTEQARNPVKKRNETKRNEEDQKQLLADDAKQPRRSASKPLENWTATFGDWWNEHVGAVPYGRVGRDLKPAYTLHGLEKLLAGAVVYNDPQEGPARKSFADFAANCAFWIGLAGMSMFDADGNDTLRCKRIPTKTRPGAA
ncbi:MAG: hypothetical protein EKK62_17070 [Acidimicrobiia bacterium]|nr:MAG: hypothetical protein EKK62_17070 [Acidimicrobiia bacterium]